MNYILLLNQVRLKLALKGGAPVTGRLHRPQKWLGVTLAKSISSGRKNWGMWADQSSTSPVSFFGFTIEELF